MNRAYRIALFLGTFPLVVGTLIFLMWLLTRWDWLQVAGTLWLFVGTLFVLAGFIALIRFRAQVERSKKIPERRIMGMALACVILFLSNFGAAFWIVSAVMDIKNRESIAAGFPD